MKKILLPQDIHLLSLKWADPEHLSLDETKGPYAWRRDYQERLECTIAEWLAKGILAYQYPLRRIRAFVPISHLIGTSRESISYVESLVGIAEELKDFRDPFYTPHPNEAFPETDFVSLHDCFAGGVAKAIIILVNQLIENESQRAQCFQALIDELTLIQAIKPQKAGSALYIAWSALHSKATDVFSEITEACPWVLEHAFALACYADCNIATSKEIKGIIDDLEVSIGQNTAPKILINDLKACRYLFSLDKQNNIERVPLAQTFRQCTGPSQIIGNWFLQIDSQYQYPDIGAL